MLCLYYVAKLKHILIVRGNDLGHIRDLIGRISWSDGRYVDRKYKDYVYRKMLVQEYLKKWRIFKKVKPQNDLRYQDIYNCICQNTKKKRFIIHHVKPTAQLLFRIRFPI